MNDVDFDNYVEMIELMGKNSGAYQDVDLAFIESGGKKYRALDILSTFQDKTGVKRLYHNLDFLWPTIIYLGNYIQKRGFTFDYINLFQLEKHTLKEKLLKEDILTIAITTTLYISAEPILEIIAFIKKYNSKVKIIVGGPFIFNISESMENKAFKSLLNYMGADLYVINSEGEAALVNSLNALKNGSDLNKVPNIAYKNGKEIIITEKYKEKNSIEENCIEYGIFPKSDIGEFLSLRTAKSCPFHCAYCSFPKRANKYEYLSVEMIEKELDKIRELGTVSLVTFIDDTFNVPKGRFKEILRMMIRNKYRFKWNSYYRCDHGDDEIIELMKEAGCLGVFLGVESGSDFILEKMNKTSRNKDFRRFIPLLKNAGIITHANLIVGFPGETTDTFKETVELIEDTEPDFFRAQMWYADPITPIWEKKDEYNIQNKGFNWSHYTMDNQTAYRLINEIFLSIKNSIWLPQYGFELWSVFYLLQKGMTLEQIKRFLKGYNQIMKILLINPPPRKKKLFAKILTVYKNPT